MKSSHLKMIARQRIGNKIGTLTLATLIYYAIAFGVLFAIMFVYSTNLMAKGVFESVDTMNEYAMQMSQSLSMQIISDAASLVIGALLATMSVGIMYMALKVARGQDITVNDLFFVYRNNPDKVILIYIIQYLVGYVVSIPAIFLARFEPAMDQNIPLYALYLILFIAGEVLRIIALILFSQSNFIYLDNPNENVLTCIMVSVNTMKKNKWRYFCLSFSFFGLMLLIVLTCGMAALWVMPYMYVTFALFYLQLRGETGSRVDVTINE